jgi:hypothetical protein
MRWHEGVAVMTGFLGYGLIAMTLLSAPSVGAQQYDCEGIDPDRSTTVPFGGISFLGSEMTVTAFSPALTARLIDIGGAGRVYLAPNYLFLAFGREPPAPSEEVFDLGPVDVVALYRDPVAPIVTELSCVRAKP